MKKVLFIMFIAIYLLTSGCADSKENMSSVSADDSSESNIESSETIDSSTETEEIISKPGTNDELYSYVIEKWRDNDIASLYPYASKEITEIMNQESFEYMFSCVSDIGGGLLSDQITEKEQQNGNEVYTAQLNFKNITLDLTLALKNTQITSFYKNVHFKNEFEIKRENNITERYFVLQSDGYDLNAVYTYVSDGQKHPTVLLIAGSGVSDYNETIGLLTPFEDIAEGLAEHGINSLRIDKRTLNYAKDIKVTDGINEEYLIDYKEALTYLKAQDGTGSIFLLGHSLGGQIAPKLTSEDNEIAGMVLFNSSARNLGDIAYDQYSSLDPANESTYRQNADAVKAATAETAKGLYYFYTSDYYWASLNALNVIGDIKNADVPTLIINSRNDKQAFDADITLWNENFSDSKKVTIYIDDSISHYGYEIDVSDPNAIYNITPFPDRLINLIYDFITEV